ncbi:hypothetical protein KKG52_00405 [Patescibacteria group bacterium]|nr:hypothetical protein [Patescibacteria group bacterium]
MSTRSIETQLPSLINFRRNNEDTYLTLFSFFEELPEGDSWTIKKENMVFEWGENKKYCHFFCSLDHSPVGVGIKVGADVILDALKLKEILPVVETR